MQRQQPGGGDVPLLRGERLERFGRGHIVAERGALAPCPWAFDVAACAPPLRAEPRLLDLGCGSGSLLLALGQRRRRLGRCVGVDLDARSLDAAARSAALAGLDSTWLRADVRSLPGLRGGFDLVLCNPPFYPPGWGRVSPDPRVAAATHALSGDIVDFSRAAAAALGPRGAALFLYDSGRLSGLLLALAEGGLCARRTTFLVDDRGLPARVVVLARPGRGGLAVERRHGASSSARPVLPGGASSP